LCSSVLTSKAVSGDAPPRIQKKGAITIGHQFSSPKNHPTRVVLRIYCSQKKISSMPCESFLIALLCHLLSCARFRPHSHHLSHRPPTPPSLRFRKSGIELRRTLWGSMDACHRPVLHQRVVVPPQPLRAPSAGRASPILVFSVELPVHPCLLQ
jgi:hypothetical protein